MARKKVLLFDNENQFRRATYKARAEAELIGVRLEDGRVAIRKDTHGVETTVSADTWRKLAAAA